MTTTREIIGWSMVFMGGACGVAAAAFQGGVVPALSAASGAFTAAAAMWGYSNKPPATTPPTPKA